MIRRFVNLVAANHTSCMYSLHRLDVAKHLFYPSTAEAEEANAKEDSHNGGGGGGGDKPRMPSRIEALRRLPEPIVRFQQFPPYHSVHCIDDDDVEVERRNYRWSPWHDTFVLLSPSGSIFHATEEGHAVLYDSSAGSITTLPTLNGPDGDGYRPIDIAPIATSAAGDGRDGKAADKESLYVITIHQGKHGPSLQVLDITQYPPKWQSLPPPPFAYGESITSFTMIHGVADGGSTICVSTRDVWKGESRTYCFDTNSHRWWHAGDWMLPFDGRAEYVPELNAWLGLRFSWTIFDDDQGKLCASTDLHAAMDGPPTLQHVWEDLRTPPKEEEKMQLSRRFHEIVIERTKEWRLLRGNLINLGGGRFCVAKVFQVEQVVRWAYEDDTETEAEFVVLTGVEVLRDGEGEELRMVKHRSKRYRFANDRIQIQWVL